MTEAHNNLLARRASPRRTPDPIEQVEFVSVLTLVLWLATLAIGLAGLLLPGGTAKAPPATQPAEPPTELLNVMLEDQPAPVLQETAAPSPATADQAAALPPDTPPAMPTLVAAPNPAIAFAVPVAGPTQRSDAAHAGLTKAPAASPLPPVRQLVYGRGEGRQPAPQYPPEAVADQQQGVVTVRFLVDPSGQVQWAEAISPCPWSLLNDAAVRAVRDTWRFQSGPARLYEVAIRFQLRQL